jgi:hypothetical protein
VLDDLQAPRRRPARGPPRPRRGPGRRGGDPQPRPPSHASRVSPLLVAGDVSSVTATVLAWPIVAQRPEHRPVALLLSLGLAADLVQRVLVSAVLNVPGPYAGGERVAFHVQEAAFIAWTFGIVATVIAVYAKRRP